MLRKTPDMEFYNCLNQIERGRFIGNNKQKAKELAAEDQGKLCELAESLIAGYKHLYTRYVRFIANNGMRSYKKEATEIAEEYDFSGQRVEDAIAYDEFCQMVENGKLDYAKKALHLLERNEDFSKKRLKEAYQRGKKKV